MSNKFQKQLFDQFDCACSALLLNCGQFGCCIANVAEFEYGIGDCRQWMTQLASAKPDAVLRDLIIPGTHDSGSYSFPNSRPFSAVSKTQNCTVYEQLQRGIRYLDIRVAGNGDKAQDVYIFHGFMAGCQLTAMLDDIVKFMEENPGEFVFLHVVQEYGQSFSLEQRIHTFDLLQTTFGEKLYQDKDFPKLITGMTLDDILNKSSARCVVLLHNRILKDFTHEGVEYTENHILDTYGYFISSRYMFDKWHNTRKVDQLLEWNIDEVQRHGGNRGKLLCNQVLLTPGVSGPGDVLELLVGKNSLRPVTFATSLYKRDVLDNFFREHAEKKWNILKLDFCDLIPALLSFLIGLNFPTPLTIRTAAVAAHGEKPINVTDKIQNFVKRDRVLYLTNVQEDLGLASDEGTLTIAFRHGHSQDIFEVDFDHGTEIVLGEFTRNESGELVHVDQTRSDVSDGKGVFHRGKILSTDEYSSLSTKSGTAIKISKKATEFAIL